MGKDNRSTPEQRRLAAEQRLARLVRAGLSPSTLGLVVERELVALEPADLEELDAVARGQLRQRLVSAYEHGWLPLDLIHAVRRSRDALVGVIAPAMVAHGAEIKAEERAPQRWRDQLRVVADDDHGMSPPPLVPAWTDLLELLAVMTMLPPLEQLVPPPSRWGRTAAPRRLPGDASDRDRLLNKIRTLLAKAEATDFAAEAETFTAKAQDLMTRHAIDEAVVRAAEDQPIEIEGIRVHIHNPYASEKVQLLNEVARANRARAVWNKPCGMVTVIGTPVDVDQVEMLFTSLLIQATRAMAEAGARRTGAFERSASFRRSFLMAYALRIGERLRESAGAAVDSYGTDLVPVLQRQEEAVRAEYERLFPHTSRARSGSYNGIGWAAGRAAADQATFTAGRLSA